MRQSQFKWSNKLSNPCQDDWITRKSTQLCITKEEPTQNNTTTNNGRSIKNESTLIMNVCYCVQVVKPLAQRLLMPCGHLLGKDWLTSWLSFVMSNCEFVTFLLVSWVRCGTWLHRFLIFALFITFNIFRRCLEIVRAILYPLGICAYDHVGVSTRVYWQKVVILVIGHQKAWAIVWWKAVHITI